MTEAIIVALITVTGSIVCQIIINRRTVQKELIERARQKQEVADTLSMIEKRLDEHNNYASRFSEMTSVIHDIQIGMASMQKDIEYLRKEVSNHHGNE